MTALGTPAARGTPSALAEPLVAVPPRWVLRVSLAGLGVWAGTYGPLQVLLAQQAQAVVPGHKELAFGVVTGVGSGVAVLASPLLGALSDRTVLRFGRRVPWVAGGALVGALGLVLLAGAGSLPTMLLAWGLTQLGLTAMLVALSASVPDLVPVPQRGAVGGWVALAQTLGIVGGVGLATATGGVGAGYVATAALVVVLAVPYVLGGRDLPLPLREQRREPRRERPSGVRWAAVSTSLRRHPDFAWAWLTRFLVNLGNSLGTLLLFFYLQDAVRYDDPERGVLVLTVVYAVLIVLSTVVVGAWSDRVGRRKVFVVGSGALTGLAALILALVQTWPGALAGAVVLGVGYGGYLSVDFALCTEVLPAASARARDLGVINIALQLPQMVAPLLGLALIACGGGYLTLYLVAALCCGLASLLVCRIDGVR